VAEILTSRLKIIKNDDDEFVDIDEINAGFDKIDNNFIPACMMAFTGSQTPASGSTVTQDMNQTRHDTYSARAEGPMADLTNNLITIRRKGIYVLTCSSGFAANATNNRRLGLEVNAVEQINLEVGPKPIGAINMVISIAMSLSVNDQVRCTVLQTSGIALAVSAGGAPNGVHISATWVGDPTEV
jgi:hypothetical protein